MTAVNRAWSYQNVLNDCASWPDASERARWLELFGDDHIVRKWVRETAYQNASVYSRYFLLTGETEVTPRGLKTFVKLCEMGAMKRKCCPRTVAGYVAAIYKVLRLLHPENRYRSFSQIVLAMNRSAERTPKRRAAAVSDAVDLERFGWHLIATSRETRRTDRSAMLFRTGIYILMGLYMPERLRAYTSLRVAQVNFETGLIHFQPGQEKNKRESIRRIPPQLFPAIREWLDIRSSFQPDHDFFWISLKGGGAAVEATLYAALRAETDDPREFGSPVTPNLLRNADATFIVRHAPEKAPLVSEILAHRDPEIAREYINGAGMIEASRDAADVIMNSCEPPKVDRRRGRKISKRGKLILTPPA